MIIAFFFFFSPCGKLPFVQMKTFQEKKKKKPHKKSLAKILVEPFVCLFPNVVLMKSRSCVTFCQGQNENKMYPLKTELEREIRQFPCPKTGLSIFRIQIECQELLMLLWLCFHPHPQNATSLFPRLCYHTLNTPCSLWLPPIRNAQLEIFIRVAHRRAAPCVARMGGAPLFPALLWSSSQIKSCHGLSVASLSPLSYPGF